MDNYPTPKSIKRMFENWFDPCELSKGELRAFDGLGSGWEDRTFVNPPYSKPLPWVMKAIQESKKGKRIVMLLKADTSTEVYAALHKAKADIFWCSKRLHYGEMSPAMFPSMLVFL